MDMRYVLWLSKVVHDNVLPSVHLRALHKMGVPMKCRDEMSSGILRFEKSKAWRICEVSDLNQCFPRRHLYPDTQYLLQTVCIHAKNKSLSFVYEELLARAKDLICVIYVIC